MQDDTSTEKQELETAAGTTAAKVESVSAETAGSTEEHKISHIYFEVGDDLLSKPNALSDIIQAEGYPVTVIFCNSPSEADMVDVILKKRGISCQKLIGHVPFTKVSQCLHQIAEKQLTALIVTDIAARDLDPGAFELVINYSIHEDPEIYLHRITGHEKTLLIKKSVCLISPLDFGNFHYLKKVVDFEFAKADLPSEEQILAGEVEKLFELAAKSDFLSNSRIKHFTAMVKDSPKLESVLAMLLNNTLNVLPKLQSGTRDRGESRDSDAGRERGRERDNRRRDSRDGDNRYQSRDRRRDDGRRDDMRHQGDSRGRYDDRDLPPPKKDIRIYLGHGTNDKLTEKAFYTLIQQYCNLGEEQIKRLTIRESYSFVDLPEELAGDALEALKGAKLENGTDLFFKKATTISAPREAFKSEEEDEVGEAAFGQTADDGENTRADQTADIPAPAAVDEDAAADEEED